MKILWITDPAPNYISAQFYQGFAKLLGAENVVMIPYKKAHCVGWSDMPLPLIQGAWSNPDIPDHTWQEYYDAKNYNWENVDSMISNGAFSLTILESVRGSSLETAINLYKKHGDKLRPLVMINTEDLAHIYERCVYKGKQVTIPHVFSLLMPDMYFKREILPNDPLYRAHPRVYPCAFANSVHKKYIDMFSNVEKEYDILCAMSNVTQERRDIKHMLTALSTTTKLNIHTAFIPYWIDYMHKIASSRIAIDAPGAGFLTLRGWEIPTYNTLMFRKNPHNHAIIPNDWTDGVNVVNYDNIPDLKQKLLMYLDRDISEISKECSKHLYKYHTDIKRADYIINMCKKEGVI